MSSVSTFNPGQFRDIASPLHRFDPRLKLLLLLGTIACLFSAHSFIRLAIIALVWCAGAGFVTPAWRDGLRLLRLLRWLLLFTLLLHLFFTPGRTLFGTSWLSYDGLLRGLLVDAQLALAVLFSLLLSWTTRPAELAWGLARLLSPLQRFRVPVAEAGGLLLLVLHFFPLVQDEVVGLRRQRRAGLEGAGFVDSLRMTVGLVGPLVLRLIDRADALARDIAGGKGPLLTEEPGRDGRLCRFDLLFFGAGIVVLLLLWML